MHELTNTPKRYQNPEVFEQLAIEYAVGSLQGRARKRFEVLMDTHFYLRATVDAYEAKFANLVELLPERQPSKQVWNNIEAHIKESSVTTAKVASSQEEKAPWWQMNFFKQGFGLAAMALIVSAVLIYNPMTDHNPVATASYSAVLESDDNGQAMAVTKIQKSDMKLSIDIMKPMYVEDGMELTLWCHPKTEMADSDGKPELVKAFQDATALVDSAGLCIFTTFAWGMEDIAPQIDAACEGDWSVDKCLEAGERIWNMERQYNNAAGFTSDDDTLPKRLLKEAIKSGPTEGQVSKLGEMLPVYYEVRGWTPQGVPTADTLSRLGLS